MQICLDASMGSIERCAATGQLRPGMYADLLIVDGDPLHNVRILEDRAQLRLIMEGWGAGEEYAVAIGAKVNFPPAF